MTLQEQNVSKSYFTCLYFVLLFRRLCNWVQWMTCNRDTKRAYKGFRIAFFLSLKNNWTSSLRKWGINVFLSTESNLLSIKTYYILSHEDCSNVVAAVVPSPWCLRTGLMTGSMRQEMIQKILTSWVMSWELYCQATGKSFLECHILNAAVNFTWVYWQRHMYE